MQRKFRLGVSASAMMLGAAVTTFGAAGSANAAGYETNYASDTSDGAAQCAYELTYPGSGFGWVCFEKYGDILWVTRSFYEDSRTSMRWVNQLKNSSGSWVDYRSGECINDLGESTWGVCNKDFYESSSRNALGGYGSRIAYKACTTTSCSALSPWVYNDG